MRLIQKPSSGSLFLTNGWAVELVPDYHDVGALFGDKIPLVPTLMMFVPKQSTRTPF